MVKLNSTDYVVYDRANDHIIEFSQGEPVIFGVRDEAEADCRGNEEVISCTALPTHKQVELLRFLKFGRMNYEQFIGGRKMLSVLEYCRKWLGDGDVDSYVNEYRAKTNTQCVAIYDYNGLHIEHTTHNEKPFQVCIDRSEYQFKTLGEAEKFFWEKFAKDEV